MIQVKVNEPDFEYDIHSLLKAFFPREEVVVIAQPRMGTDTADGVEDPAGSAKSADPPQVYGRSAKRHCAAQEAGEHASLFLDVIYEADCITATLSQRSAEAYRTDSPASSEACCAAAQDSGEMSRTASVPVHYTDPDNMSMRVETKNRLKRLLYRLLSEYTGRTLPWGTLTGIRPTKIPMKGLEEGKSDADILAAMKETYLISDEKAALSLEIARKEREILSRIDYRSGYSLYIGIPFCPTRCLYCSFTSYPIAKWAERTGDYIDALETEMAGTAPMFADRRLQTVYIGGGTPTSLDAASLDRLLTLIETHFDLSDVLEFTVEGGRPDSFTPEKLCVLRAHPVTRISVNPQTMNQQTLDLIGRAHTTEQTEEAFAMAREAGFDNINMDLILGLPGEDREMVQHTLSRIAALRPDSLTVHSLALKRAARLREEFAEYAKYGMRNSDALMNLVRSCAADLGLAPYYLYRQKNMTGNLENVGYAAPGREGLYNILIMEEKQTILSLGAAGMTKFVTDGRPVRTENVKDVDQYITRIDEMVGRKRTCMKQIRSDLTHAF